MIKSKDERLKLGKQWNQVVVDNDDGELHMAVAGSYR